MANDEEFWRDDAKPDPVASTLRMPAAAVVIPADLMGSHATASADYRAMPEPKPGSTTQGWLFVGSVVVISAVVGINVARWSSNQVKVRQQATASVYGRASANDLVAYSSVMAVAIKEGVVLKLETGHERAELFVLPAFHLLNVDQKTKLIRFAYYSAFRLPSSAHRFPWPMAVMDGLSGNRLRTVNMDGLGLQW